MTSRNAARRHHGRNRMVPRNKPEPEPVQLDPHTSPVDAIKWWRYQDDKPRFVYFIQEGDDGPVKIGEAFDPVKRLSELQCGNPRALALRAVVLATDETERSLHLKWSSIRIRGEWFESERIVPLAQQVQGEQIDAVRDKPSYFVAALAERLICPNPLPWRTLIV